MATKLRSWSGLKNLVKLKISCTLFARHPLPSPHNIAILPHGGHSLLHPVLHLNPLPPLSTPTKLSKHAGLHINQTKQGHEKIQSACEIFLSSIVSCHSAAAVRVLCDCGKIRFPDLIQSEFPIDSCVHNRASKKSQCCKRKLCCLKPETHFQSNEITEVRSHVAEQTCGLASKNKADGFLRSL